MEFVDVKEEALVKMYQLFSQYPEMDIQQLENVLCNRKLRCNFLLHKKRSARMAQYRGRARVLQAKLFVPVM